MAKRAGKQGRIQWVAVNLKLKEYSVDHKADDLDTTTFEDNGKETGLTGVEVLDCSARGDWDSANYTVDPPGIYCRADGGPVKLYPNVADGNFYSMPIVRILSARHSNPVRQTVGFDIGSFKSNGAFTLPQGQN